MPLPSSRELARLSRDRAFLVRASIFLVILAFIISGVIAAFKPNQKAKTKKPTDTAAIIPGADLDPDLNAEEMAAALRNRDRAQEGFPVRDFRDLEFYQAKKPGPSPKHAAYHSRIESSTSMNEGHRERLFLLLDGLHGDPAKRGEVIEKLHAIPESKRYRNEFLGDILLAEEKHEEAILSYVKEGENFREATYSQRSAIFAYMEREELGELRVVLEKPGFGKSLTPTEKIATTCALRDYGRLLIDVIKFDFARLLSPMVFIALFTAGIWFAVLVIMGSFTKRDLGRGLIAFFLGMISASLTLYFVYIQEHFRNFTHHPEDTLINQFIAMIAGIGLREETLKLLCFVPVAIAILKYRSPILALVTAALTGLGFAMMENVGYMSSPTANTYEAWGRLLSANVMHFCMTGIVGFSFYRLVRNRGRGWENFLIDFLFVVAIHGVYDGFIMIPQLQEYGPVATLIIIATTAYRYLDLVRENMNTVGQMRKISPLGVFIMGAVLLACGILVISVTETTFLKAIGGFATAVGSLIPVSFAFINRLRDT